MVILGSDHAGFDLKEAIKNHLDAKGVEYEDVGAYDTQAVDYAIIASKLAKRVLSEKNLLGILCCGTGIGISIAANKVKGIRAACCANAYCAEMTRQHNNANVLALGGRVLEGDTAIEIVDIFLSTPFSGEERHQRRIDQITAIENGEL